MAMNIWIFNHYAVPMKLFPHARPHYFAKLLHEKGHEVTLFAASSVHNSDVNLITEAIPYIEQEEAGVKYIFLKTSSYAGNGMSRIKNMFQYFKGILTNASQFSPPDVIVAMSVHPLACVAGIILAKKYKCKCVVDIADLWPESFVSFGIVKANNPILKLLYAGEKWIYKKADAVIFSMEGGAQYIKDKGWDKQIPLSKVYHINNGVDLEQFDTNRDLHQIEDEDLDRLDCFKVVYTGSIRKTASLNNLVKVAEKLKDSALLFLIYGDGDERAQLETYCKEKDITNIKFKGRVDKKCIPYVLSKSNLNIINVQPTEAWMKYGSSENKLFEYLASGKPICANVKPSFSVVEKYDCGIEKNVCDEQEYAEMIRWIVELDDERYTQLCNNARVAARDYDFNILVDRLEQIIFSVCQSKR